MVYEKRIAEMMMTMQKQERDILYKDEELKSIKNIARDVAEQLEVVKSREDEFKKVYLQKEETISQRQLENEVMRRQMEGIKAQLSD